MALGPFVRIIAQIAVVAGGHIGRAVAEAYKEAAAGRGAAGAAAQRIARRRMSLDEAKKVLDADAADGPAKIQERFDVLHKLNAPSENSPGSPYLQSRITAAHKVLLEEMAKADKSKKAPNPPDDKTE
mmetsp:Transcript_124792/g.349576  ORF Transcript_124792/g.349576 Transcript_124792/m.349576 type:complete len:128 (-) Transcript_124792:116-499(-)